MTPHKETVMVVFNADGSIDKVFALSENAAQYCASLNDPLRASAIYEIHDLRITEVTHEGYFFEIDAPDS